MSVFFCNAHHVYDKEVVHIKDNRCNWSKAKNDRITDYYQNKQMNLLNPGDHDYSRMSVADNYLHVLNDII